MAVNFITNQKEENSLDKRLKNLIPKSEELKFLVGFFYFGSLKSIYETLKHNPEVKVNILVGLEVIKACKQMVEVGTQNKKESQRVAFDNYLKSLYIALNNKDLDTEEAYEQVRFFIKMILEDKLIIRKGSEPNHAKLYLFKLNAEKRVEEFKDGYIITGSSNLTKAGLVGQNEFNVQISDYGFKEAEQYFDNFWNEANEITENPDFKKELIDFIENQTLFAEVTPFETYCKAIKSYYDTYNEFQGKISYINDESFFENKGIEKYSYQTDAVKQAIRMLNQYDGCIISDVVGLGKSVIASLIGKELGKKGIIICPPALQGDQDKRDSGWWEYIDRFELSDWRVFSRGKLDIIEESIKNKNYEVVVVDEAHYFRNEDTADYSNLKSICAGRKVILLSATPFNNSPMDIYYLISLFQSPKNAKIGYERNLKKKFEEFNKRFKDLLKIKKNYNTSDEKEFSDIQKIYQKLIKEPFPMDLKKVDEALNQLSKEIKNTIKPVLIRRNRKDLENDAIYNEEVGKLSKVLDPEEHFYGLTEEQDVFYDKILTEYFGKKGKFSGAIYQPYFYQEDLDIDDLNQDDNFRYNQQKNLFDFMRRLLVKRFESSFGAFEQSVERFLEIHKIVSDFINKNNKYILDRKFLNKIKDLPEDEILNQLTFYQAQEEGNEVYHIDDFKRKEEFLNNIKNDIALFEEIKSKIKELHFVENDPKQQVIIAEIKKQLTKNPNRKIILFSEYADTIKHLKKSFERAFPNQVLVCDGDFSKTDKMRLEQEFNAKYKGEQTNSIKILISTDKLSEGVNLNRAGLIINYDIPWNPTRVIQRVGRINRIGKKMFDELYIFNFFPSQKGSDVVKVREIASHKMSLIHEALGEDAKIFDKDEKPSPANLSKKIIDTEEEISLETQIRNLYHQLSKEYPKIFSRIEKLPYRIKSVKWAENYGVYLLEKRGNQIFPILIDDEGKLNFVEDEVFLEGIKSEFSTPRGEFSPSFWENYQKITAFKEDTKSQDNENSASYKAKKNLKAFQKSAFNLYKQHKEDIDTLMNDIDDYEFVPSYDVKILGKSYDFSKPKDTKKFLEEIMKIKDKFFGKIPKREPNEDEKNLIIAVENNKKS